MLPLSPQLGDCAQVVRSRPSTMSQALDELSNLLKENEPKQVNVFIIINMYIIALLFFFVLNRVHLN